MKSTYKYVLTFVLNIIFLTTTLFGQSEIGISKLKIISFANNDPTHIIDIVTVDSSGNPTDELYLTGTLAVDSIGLLKIELDYVTNAPGEMVELRVLTSEGGDIPIYTATDNTGSFQEFLSLDNVIQPLIENGEQLFFKLYGEGSGDGQNLVASGADAMWCVTYSQDWEGGPPVIVMDSSIQIAPPKPRHYRIAEQDTMMLFITNEDMESKELKEIKSGHSFNYNELRNIMPNESVIVPVPLANFEKGVIYTLVCDYNGGRKSTVYFVIDDCLGTTVYDCDDLDVSGVIEERESIELGCPEENIFVTTGADTRTELQAEKAICFLPGYVSEENAVVKAIIEPCPTGHWPHFWDEHVSRQAEKMQKGLARNTIAESSEMIVRGIDKSFKPVFRLAPNPFLDFTTIDVDVPENASIEIAIFSMTGAELFAMKKTNLPEGNHQYNLGAHLPRGIYFCKISINHNVFIEKIFKL